MHTFLTVVILISVGFASNQSLAAEGTVSNPESRGWVEQDGKLVSAGSTRAAIARRAAAAAEAAQRQADFTDRPALMEKYILKFGGADRARGVAQWNGIGAWKTTAELRRVLGAVAVLGVVGTAVGMSPDASAATVNIKSPETPSNKVSLQANDVPAAGSVGSSYRSSNSSTAGNTKH